MIFFKIFKKLLIIVLIFNISTVQTGLNFLKNYDYYCRLNRYCKHPHGLCKTACDWNSKYQDFFPHKLTNLEKDMVLTLYNIGVSKQNLVSSPNSIVL